MAYQGWQQGHVYANGHYASQVSNTHSEKLQAERDRQILEALDLQLNEHNNKHYRDDGHRESIYAYHDKLESAQSFTSKEEKRNSNKNNGLCAIL